MPRARWLVRAARELAADERDGIAQWKLFGGFRSAVAVFELAGGDAAVAHDHAVRDTDELGVRELDARTLVAIVEQNVDSRGQQFVVEAFGSFTDGG